MWVTGRVRIIVNFILTFKLKLLLITSFYLWYGTVPRKEAKFVHAELFHRG